MHQICFMRFIYKRCQLYFLMNQSWGPFCAGVVLAAIPVVILFLFLQRFIVHGLTSGSVKG